ncbi:MAG: transposase [Magnetococcus sp. DMHC-6]
MARISRLTVPGVSHHVIQRGNRRLPTFFSEDDYRYYLNLLSEFSRKAGTEVWAYCLMPNHVHLILVPSHGDGLRQTLGEMHRRYTCYINEREKWRGHLWQERFHSFPMDDLNLLMCARYVELNPIRVHLVSKAEDWPWSSVHAHLRERNDGVVHVQPLLDRISNWQEFLCIGLEENQLETLRCHSRTGHPLGSEEFYAKLHTLLGVDVCPRKRGRPKKTEALNPSN